MIDKELVMWTFSVSIVGVTGLSQIRELLLQELTFPEIVRGEFHFSDIQTTSYHHSLAN